MNGRKRVPPCFRERKRERKKKDVRKENKPNERERVMLGRTPQCQGASGDDKGLPRLGLRAPGLAGPACFWFNVFSFLILTPLTQRMLGPDTQRMATLTVPGIWHARTDDEGADSGLLEGIYY